MRRSAPAAASGSPADGNNRRHYTIRMLALIPAATHFTTGHKYPERKNPHRPQQRDEWQNYQRPSALRGTPQSRSFGSLLQSSFERRYFKLTSVAAVKKFLIQMNRHFFHHKKQEGGICYQAACALAKNQKKKNKHCPSDEMGPNNEKVHLVLDTYQAASKETLVAARQGTGSSATISAKNGG